MLAEEDLRNSGYNIKVIYEDSHCDGKAAVTAFQKLVESNNVKFIVGGHSSPESSAIVPLAITKKITLLAAITSSPKLSSAGIYFSRLTPLLTEGSIELGKEIIANSKIKKVGIIHEDTDYAMPLAEKLKDVLTVAGKEVTIASFVSSENDFRAILTKLAASKIDALYIGVQSKDKANIILKQLFDQKIILPLYGTVQAALEYKDKFSAANKTTFSYVDPLFDFNTEKTAKFIKRFEDEYNTKGLPLGIWTAEAYDAVHLMAEAVKRCGADPLEVSKCLRKTKDYIGVSGRLTISENGDGVRELETKSISGG